jgi:hypothetical protein
MQKKKPEEIFQPVRCNISAGTLACARFVSLLFVFLAQFPDKKVYMHGSRAVFLRERVGRSFYIEYVPLP